MRIRLLNSQMEEAVKLIWETFLQFEAPEYSEQGIASFRTFIENPQNRACMEFFGAYEGSELRGVLATRRDRSHICLFFVRDRYQHQGIGRMLWEYLLRHSRQDVYTVNSSPYAVPIYHKLGFVDTGREQEVDGIRFTPMEFIRPERKYFQKAERQ